MSVLIKDMEKPKSCYAVIDGASEYCPFVNTDDDCVLQLKKGICEGTWKEQYSKCPLVETPEQCEDAVSRVDVLECFSDLYDTFEDCSKGIVNELHRKFEDLRTLPSVSPKQRTGEWIDDKCSLCGQYVYYGDMRNYCPNCGAKMNGGNQDE